METQIVVQVRFLGGVNHIPVLVITTLVVNQLALQQVGKIILFRLTITTAINPLGCNARPLL